MPVVSRYRRANQRKYGVLLDTLFLKTASYPLPVDITKKETIPPAFENADIVVSLVGIMHGSTQDFTDVQLKGAENVAKCAKDAGAKLIHFSAIGADPNSKIPYVKTKGLAEQSILALDSTATIIRPSLVFGPEDDFFNVRIDHFRSTLV